MGANNIIVADFTGGGRKVTAATLWQYDYGQILQFRGIADLPASYEVHFSNEKDGGYTKTQIGDEDGVSIPDEYFLTGKTIYAWLYLHATEDDGATEYQVTIPINKRSRPADYAPTTVEQSAITQAIAALNVAVDAAEAAQGKAETAQGKAEEAHGKAETAQEKAETAQGKAEAAEAGVEADALKAEGYAVGKQDGTDVESGSPYYHNNAKYYAERAAAYEAGAEQAIGNAKDAALGAIGDAKTAAVGDVNAAGTTQVGKVNDAGTAQVAEVNSAGAIQKAAAQQQAEAAAGSATAAAADALKAEGYAQGKQNGTDVASGSPYYQNNAKYYKEQAASSAQAAAQAQTAAEAATSSKADKVTGATSGDVASLDANGNLVDNGNKYHPDLKDETMPLRVGVDASGRLWASGDSGSERFGVRGVGGASTALTRLWDAVGLTATAGTDVAAGDSAFDAFPIFNRRKCVGTWALVDGKAVFTVQAYEGDADYAEDGSMGDYVAVDVPPLYWYHEETTGTLGVSGDTHPGWEPHPICLDKDGNIREHTYLPVYALALKNGHAVSLPGYDNIFGNYKNLWDAARTYGDGTLTNKAIIEPSVVDHYEWLLMTIEFATTNPQGVINGAVSMPYTTDVIHAAPAANKAVVTGTIGDKYVVGQTVYIGADHGTTPTDTTAYNHITAIEKCDADGTLNASGTYRLIAYDGADRSSSITADTTRIASRPWITGATAGFASGVSAVKGHTGSPVSNSSGKYPFRYRWRENVYGNQNMTALDLFNARTADGTSYHLDWYYNDNLRFDGASLYYPSSTSKPDLTDLQTAANGFRKLTTTTPKEHYADGYIKEEGFDADLPCIRVPTVTGSPASASAYYADYAYLVNSTAVRAVRRRGYLNYGAYIGPRYVSAIIAPSYANWAYGAALYMAQ
jgi:hypothetical protein